MSTVHLFEVISITRYRITIIYVYYVFVRIIIYAKLSRPDLLVFSIIILYYNSKIYINWFSYAYRVINSILISDFLLDDNVIFVIRLIFSMKLVWIHQSTKYINLYLHNNLIKIDN